MAKDKTTDPGREMFQEIAWRDFIMWAHSESEMVKAWTQATGHSFGKSANPLEGMIDDATGKSGHDAESFVMWVTEHHWGLDEAPAALQAKFAKRTSDGQ